MGSALRIGNGFSGEELIGTYLHCLQPLRVLGVLVLVIRGRFFKENTRSFLLIACESVAGWDRYGRILPEELAVHAVSCTYSGQTAVGSYLRLRPSIFTFGR